jgi:2-methylcitrate dehydratase PrpD
MRERSRFCQSQALAEIDKKMGKFNSLQRTLWPSQRIANPSAGAGIAKITANTQQTQSHALQAVSQNRPNPFRYRHF